MASVPSSISARVPMSAVIAAIVETSPISGPASGRPVVVLKANTVPLRVSRLGNDSVAAVSESASLIVLLSFV